MADYIDNCEEQCRVGEGSLEQITGMLWINILEMTIIMKTKQQKHLRQQE